ncbi:WD40/YVTN/BNR-like repeat-containing protein [Acidicapsa acidisoli]|uniref:WD40/YVTN/BNR-like repeat-containing protein n=1 Tax=Acidicapsa acidisoli TaxID=1615681 RepID=UPI0021E0C7D4|nr:exo-alpha-sialidase [Acidicapsa acidisoli]
MKFCLLRRRLAQCFLFNLLICLPIWLSLANTARAQDSAANVNSQAQWTPALHWRLVGPFRGGRTRAATGVVGQPNVFYVGQVNGGVWKSTDYGRTWNPIFDNESSQSIGAIAVAPSDSNIVYVASGEGLHRPDLSIGNGIYRSSDAGKTWQHLGLREGQQIPALVVDPRDPNRLFAAVLGHPYGPNEERGIYRSTDGGQNWKKVLYKDANTGGSDVVIDPAHPDVVYAGLWESRLGPWEDGNQYDGTHGGLFKSTDGGETWRPLTKGLPDNLVQIQVAIANSYTNRLYATVSTTHAGGYTSGAGLGVYRSDDAGENWYKATDDPRPALKIGGGDLAIPAVDPKNPDVVYSASIVTMRSTDGGKTWSGFRGAPGGDDYQNLWINPENPDIILLVSDQGALVSVNRGESWSSWYNQPTAQLYHVATTNEFPYKICAGQQESGSVCIASRGNDGEVGMREWHPVGIIEYGYAAPDPLHPEIIYGAGRTEVSRFNSLTGQVQNVTPLPVRGPDYRADRTEPILFSPVDQHLLFYASNVLFETKDYGRNWEKISPDLSREQTGQPESLAPLPAKDVARRRGAIYAVAASFLNAKTIWAGTDDGLLWITRDQGKNWKNITPPKLTSWSKVTQISASHFDDNTAYASVSRFRIDDLHPYIYRTQDGGVTWQTITNGLPEDSPVNTVREDPLRKGLLFAGTETAVWMSTDDGDHWQPLQYNLPHTSMRDLMIQGNDLIVATHGRSFWILDDISPLRQVAASATQTEPVLFKPGDAYRVRRSTYTDTPMPPDEPAGQNPPDGAVIDYSLPESVQGAVTLEILDAGNKVVRRYSSADAPEATQEQLAKQLIPLYWLRMPKTLPASAGMHRWVWDLRYARPTATNYQYPISAVPHDTPREPLGTLALPGTYQVRLTAGGKVLTAPLTVKIDPRVEASRADLESLFKLEYQLSGMVTSSAAAALEAHSIREQIEKLSSSASPEIKESLEKQNKELSALLSGKEKSAESGEEPGLDEVAGEASSIYTMVGMADALPTVIQQKSSEHLSKELSEVLEKWDAVKKSSIPQLNQKLRAAHLPAIDLNQEPESMPESGDED